MITIQVPHWFAVLCIIVLILQWVVSHYSKKQDEKIEKIKSKAEERTFDAMKYICDIANTLSKAIMGIKDEH